MLGPAEKPMSRLCAPSRATPPSCPSLTPPSPLQINSAYLTTPETPILSSLKETEGRVAAISRSYDPSPISEDVPMLVRNPSKNYR